MDKIDYKRTEKHLYLPKVPAIVDVPEMVFFAVDGKGDPNTSEDYAAAMELLYGLSFTVKMSKMGGETPEGYFEYVVPPLEGLWWQEGKNDGIDYTQKDQFHFISMMRLPDFVTKEEFDWAIQEATQKKKKDFSKVEFLTYDEGVCVQCMHIGSYDTEPETIEKMEEIIQENGYELDFNQGRYHHEIYLSDPRRCEASKLKTVIRHPIQKRR